MSFIGNVPAEAYSPVAKDTFSGNSSTTDFTLSIPATTNSVEVFVENVQQEPTTAYTISGTTLSFTAAPVTGTNNIYVIHRGPAVQQIVPPAGVALNPSTVDATGDISTDTGVNTDTISEKTSASGVTIDGVLLKDGEVTTDTISEKTAAAGVTIDGVLLKDGDVTATDGSFSGDMKFNSGFGSTATAYGCRAWVNFDSNNPSNAIRASGNVSSITDNGTGDHTVNFSTAMPDDDYAVSGAMNRNDGTNKDAFFSFANPATTSVQVFGIDAGGTLRDMFEVNVVIHR